MFAVQVTRARKGIVYAKAIVAGPFEHELDAQRCRDTLAESDGNIQVGAQNPDSLWEVVPHEPCDACSSDQDKPTTDHTCAQ